MKALPACACVVLALACPAFAGPDVRLARLPEGGRQPRVAVGADGSVHVVYLGGDVRNSDVYYLNRSSGQEAFGEPVRVNSQPGSAVAMGTMRGAQIALGAEGRVHVAWNGSTIAEPRGPGFAPGAAHKGLPVLYARSDGAGAFEAQRNLMTSTAYLDGGCAVAADGAGRVYVAWHASALDGSPQESARNVWLAESTDEGATFGRERGILPQALGACGCCGMAATTDPSGGIVLLYRAATGGTERGMYLLESSDQGRSFGARPLDSWRVMMCPMTSAAAQRTGDGPVLAWENQNQVYWARAGAGELKPVAPPTGAARRKHAVAGAGAEFVVLAWAEGGGMGGEATLGWQVFTAAGEPVEGGAGQQPGLPAYSFPAVIAERDGGFTILY